jgi:hypothetical protein
MRQPPNPRNQAIREFILGAILVLALQIIVGVLTVILIYGTIAIVSVFRIQPNGPLLVLIPSAPSLFIGVTQIAYLAPLFAYFAQRGRREVSKGILLGAIVTLLLNSACYATPGILSTTQYIGIATYAALAQIIAIALLISGTIGWLGVKWVQRSRPPQ